MCVGFFGFLKHVGSFIRFLDLSIFQNVFIGESSVHELKSPSEKTLSYLHGICFCTLGKSAQVWFCTAMFSIVRTTQKPFFFEIFSLLKNLQ